MDRRSLIKGAGLTVALGTIRTVSARGEKIASSEVGIDSEVEKLLSDGQIEKAETILDQHDVEYYSKEELISNNSEQENDGTVSINGRYSESYSQLHMSLVNRGNDQWLVSAYGTLQGYLSRVRDASVIEDGCGIIFDSSEWSAPEPS
ncbi:hypothetical protein RBH26_05205 [Natronolimnohabitans sp. A-GB9]|uniref:hypothetical protein n=1 Tax=Natronolimnohabitans sp. A-GB9 TaxID=3069757 RepID=UPI0027B27B51|nr:hypothetical protein [Natronolimnohabitans sp. A-GB9]MDQ2049875.1 hypothetical protein [Natronolimnohabitans sp. A-GB9]